MFFVLMSVALAEPPPAGVPQGIQAILAVGPEGTGNEAAAEGWKAIVAAGPEALVPTLRAFPKANPVALNWLRLAATAVPVPDDVTPLFEFVQAEAEHPAARQIAFDLAKSRDPEAALKLLKTRIDDRNPTLRREAIALRLPDAKDAAELKTLFAAARDADQCEELAKQLKAQGVVVDLPAHYGVMTEWLLMGPFAAPESAGHSIKYDPETRDFDPAMTVSSQGDVKLSWKPVRSADPDGRIDFSELLAKSPDVVAFLAATVESPGGQPAELRLSTPNAVKVYFNGEEVLGRDVYHQGSSRDQYIAKGTLKPGVNHILVKVAQNNQPQPWAKAWQASARLTDETGLALPVKLVLPTGERVPLARPSNAPPKESK